MPRLLGYFASQVDRVRCVLAVEPAAHLEPDARQGAGIGSHQGREVLLRRWPTGMARPFDLAELAADLRTGSMLAHVRRATVGGRTLENTQPFRFRQWLFASLGTLPGGAPGRTRLSESMPSFLSGTLRGETDSEVLFHHLLGALFRAGMLDDPSLDRDVLRSTLAAGVGALDEVLHDAAPLAFVLTDGSGSVGFSRGLAMRFTRRSGIAQCPLCSRTDQPAAHETLRYALVTDGDATEPGWRAWGTDEGGGFLTIDRNFETREARWADAR